MPHAILLGQPGRVHVEDLGGDRAAPGRDEEIVTDRADPRKMTEKDDDIPPRNVRDVPCQLPIGRRRFHPTLDPSRTAMNRPTSAPSFGPLARHIGLRRQQRDPGKISPATIRLQGRAAWHRLFPPDGDAAPSGRDERTVESATA